MPASILPFKAPRLAPEKARLLNRLCVREAEWRTSLGQGLATWEMLRECPPFPCACEVSFAIGMDRWTARFSDASFILRHPAFSVDAPAFDVEELPREVRSAVLNALLAPSVEALKSVLGVPVAIDAIRFAADGIAKAAPSPWALDLRVRLTDCRGMADQSIFVSFVPHSADGVLALAEHLSRLPQPAAKASSGLMELPLELAFESGYLDLNRNDVSTLENDDVLIPQVWHLAEGKLKLRLYRGHAPALFALCSFADGKAVLEAPLSPEVESVMDSNEHNDIDIRLSFELDRTVITLGELSTLTPGYVFQLGCDMQTPVTVRANGKAIARGRLVDMGGTLGVQLSETL